MRADKKSEIPAAIENLWTGSAFAIPTTAATVAFLTPNSFWTVMTAVPDSPGLPLFATRWLTFLALAALAFRWVIATKHESTIWGKWLDNPDDTQGMKDAVAAIFALWISLGVMLGLVHNVLLIGSYVTILYVINIWTQSLANDHYRDAVKFTRRTNAKELARDQGWARVLDVLDDYWVEKPQIGRLVAMLVLSFVALVLALIGRGDADQLHYFQIAAYLVLALDIIIGEIVVSRWRTRRDQAIRSVLHQERSSIQAKRPAPAAPEAAHPPSAGQSWLPPSTWSLGVVLALLPPLSFVLQRYLSRRAGTEEFFSHHLTVMVVDWIFIPFNFFVVRTIDWRLGVRLYAITVIAVALNVLTHAYWQAQGLDLGHMITPDGVVLAAGWVHLAFSIIETILLIAFVFCRDPSADGRVASGLAVVYFLVMVTCGYLMHHGLIASDVVVSGAGIFFVLGYPRLTMRMRAQRV